MKYSSIYTWFYCGILLFGAMHIAKAQQENTLYFMNAMPQSALYNPAKKLDFKIGISLPALSGGYFSLQNEGFSLRDAVTVDNGTATISLDNLANSLEDRNAFSAELATELIGVYLNLDKFSINFHVGDRIYTQLEYPRELVELIAKGNGHPDFLGQQIVIDPAIQGVHYREFSLGGAYEAMEGKLRLGANLKYLKGVGYIESRAVQAVLTTESTGNYPLTVSASGEVVTAGAAVFTQTNNLEDYLNSPGNSGFAVDLGASYELNDKITLELSVVNALGGISWKEEVEEYSINTANSNYTFEGIEVLDLFKAENGDELYDSGIDSLEAIFQFDNGGVATAGESFSSSVPTQIHIGGQYDLGSGLRLNALLSHRSFQGNGTTQFSVAGIKDFGRWATVALSYNAAPQAPMNVGFGFSLNLPVQVHFISDNLLSGLIAPESARYISGRIGINIAIGHIDSKKAKEE